MHLNLLWNQYFKKSIFDWRKITINLLNYNKRMDKVQVNDSLAARACSKGNSALSHGVGDSS